jgi:predicted HAD superfamily Cof-like phosphohydrolase
MNLEISLHEEIIDILEGSEVIMLSGNILPSDVDQLADQIAQHILNNYHLTKQNTMKNEKIVVYKDGSHTPPLEESFEYENDVNFLTTIHLPEKPLNYIEEVSKFHKLFEHPILADYSQLPTEDRMRLRNSLLKEEVGELAEAIQMKDIIGVADALADIQYVLSGAILEFGLQDKFPALFMEVQRSNMSKACASELEAQWTADQHKEDTGFDCFTKERDGQWFVYRSKDMKTIKSINYSPADIAKVLDVPAYGDARELIATGNGPGN